MNNNNLDNETIKRLISENAALIKEREEAIYILSLFVEDADKLSLRESLEALITLLPTLEAVDLVCNSESIDHGGISGYLGSFGSSIDNE